MADPAMAGPRFRTNDHTYKLFLTEKHCWLIIRVEFILSSVKFATEKHLVAGPGISTPVYLPIYLRTEVSLIQRHFGIIVTFVQSFLAFLFLHSLTTRARGYSLVSYLLEDKQRKVRDKEDYSHLTCCQVDFCNWKNANCGILKTLR